jgi:hypothetical protein
MPSIMANPGAGIPADERQFELACKLHRAGVAGCKDNELRLKGGGGRLSKAKMCMQWQKDIMSYVMPRLEAVDAVYGNTQTGTASQNADRPAEREKIFSFVLTAARALRPETPGVHARRARAPPRIRGSARR